ncbi:MAG: ABC transporter permease [Deltaproteobacteria bacterium]|nr:ABC transporter permease [Deltaproteobacteria bacterium]MCZ6548173.1 ABC transporter permease [Deltaproteobacteria bacterium]
MKSSVKNIAEPLVFFAVLLLLWEFLVRMTDVPDFILPPPRDLYTAFIENLYVIAIHSVVTFAEAVGGFALSFILGVGFAISVVYSRHLQNTIYPLIVILYAMPKSALAPLMVIWIGYGMFSKMSIAFLVAFFPIVVNTVVGLKEVEPELLDLARINRASQFDIFTKIRLPNSLPYLFAGVKVALILSVTGAIVAEFVAANQGLGYLIMQALYSLDTALTLVILFILALLSLGLFMTVQVLQRKIAPWSSEVRQVEGSF